jgi:hypothetical protein
MMWFSDLAEVQNPARIELQHFVEATRNFLGFVLEMPEFGFLWEDDGNLLALARETFNTDVRLSAEALQEAIPNIPQEALSQHGLVGRPMKFKFRVMDTIGRQWERVRGQFRIREWFKRIIEAIDAALSSLIDAAGGIGGLLKEFKDALSSLAKTVP